MKAYAECATYIAEKLPLENEFLKNIAAIDPIAIASRKSIVLKSLLKLPFLMKNVLVDQKAVMKCMKTTADLLSLTLIYLMCYEKISPYEQTIVGSS